MRVDTDHSSAGPSSLCSWRSGSTQEGNWVNLRADEVEREKVHVGSRS